MDLLAPTTAAATLAGLWTLEAMLPGLAGPRAGLAQRARHLALGLLNGLVAAALTLLLLVADDRARAHGFGLLRAMDLHWAVAALLAFVLLDLWQYAFHVLMHKTPALWRLHAVHHNADRLEATAAMRFHLAEIGLMHLLLVPYAVLLGIGIVDVAVYNLVLLPVSLFHHSDIRLSPRVDRALRWFIVTPHMHWVHHSRWQPETDSNYAGVLSVWDRLFGTHRTRRDPAGVDIGLDGFERREIDTVRGMLLAPFGPSRAGLGTPPPPRDDGRAAGRAPGRAQPTSRPWNSITATASDATISDTA